MGPVSSFSFVVVEESFILEFHSMLELSLLTDCIGKLLIFLTNDVPVMEYFLSIIKLVLTQKKSSNEKKSSLRNHFVWWV